MGNEVLVNLMGSAEKNAQLCLALHGFLTDRGLDELGRIAWVAFLEASTSAEKIGNALGMEVSVD